MAIQGKAYTAEVRYGASLVEFRADPENNPSENFIQ